MHGAKPGFRPGSRGRLFHGRTFEDHPSRGGAVEGVAFGIVAALAVWLGGAGGGAFIYFQS